MKVTEHLYDCECCGMPFMKKATDPNEWCGDCISVACIDCKCDLGADDPPYRCAPCEAIVRDALSGRRL